MGRSKKLVWPKRTYSIEQRNSWELQNIKRRRRISYVSNYFCLENLRFSANQVTERLYYSGELIRIYRKKTINQLSESIQNGILSKYEILTGYEFLSWGGGVHENYFVVKDQYELEIYEFSAHALPYLEFMNDYVDLLGLDIICLC